MGGNAAHVQAACDCGHAALCSWRAFYRCARPARCFIATLQKRGWITQLPKYLPWLKRTDPYYNLISDESQIWQGEATLRACTVDGRALALTAAPWTVTHPPGMACLVGPLPKRSSPREQALRPRPP